MLTSLRPRANASLNTWPSLLHNSKTMWLELIQGRHRDDSHELIIHTTSKLYCVHLPDPFTEPTVHYNSV